MNFRSPAILVALFLFLTLNLLVPSKIPFFPWLSFASALSSENGPIKTNIFVEIAKRENPAVVNVSTKSKTERMRPKPRSRGRSPRQSPDPFRDFYERFFGERERPKHGMGSGFLIDKDGYILTNAHVIEGADEINVTFQNKNEYTAKLVGSDSKTDIALIKIEKKNGDNTPFPFLQLGNSDLLEVGEWVIAIGNPFGLSHTVTVGVVSAKGRNIGAGPYDDFIQTDASINPGNSGGPLINIRGDVVGINTAIISGNSGGNVGIGFALPINLASSIINDLKEKGTVTRGWLGIMIQKVTPELAESFGLKNSEGALVGDVIPNGPADKAGIQRGDVVIKFNNKNVKEMDNLPRIVASTPPGTTIPIEIIRDGRNKTLHVTIEVLKEKVDQPTPLAADLLGIQVQDITPELAKSLELEDNEGVLVSEVDPAEPAGKAGVKRGDIVLEVNREIIVNSSVYNQIIGRLKKGANVLLLVRRNGNTIFIPVNTN